MFRKKKNGLEWLEFELLQNFPEVRHGVFLHLDFGERGDIKDQERAFDLFGVSGVKLKQVHQDRLIKINTSPSKLQLHEGFDGMLTQEKEIGLLCEPSQQAGLLGCESRTGYRRNIFNPSLIKGQVIEIAFDNKRDFSKFLKNIDNEMHTMINYQTK